MQIGHGTRSDCVLAETFLRLDHLEDAIQAVKHEEMMRGMMMRMDHLAEQIEHAQEFTSDRVEEAEKRADYKDQVRLTADLVQREQSAFVCAQRSADLCLRVRSMNSVSGQPCDCHFCVAATLLLLESAAAVRV
jgi:hypothetical protein